MYSIVMLLCTLSTTVVEDIKPGDQVRLAGKSDDVVLAATNYLNWVRLRELIDADDAVGVRQMVDKGTVVLLPGGSLGKAIKSRDRSVEVRLTGGKHDGKAYFIPKELVNAHK